MDRPRSGCLGVRRLPDAQDRATRGREAPSLEVGDSRGAHNMPIMPVPMNTATTGFYCLPIISCVGFSVNSQGQFSAYHTDFFDNPAWDYVRLQAQKKAIAMRNQGWSGAAMMAKDELEYTEHVQKVLKHLREAELQVDIKKSKFNVKRTKYLGFIISTDGIKTDPRRQLQLLNGNFHNLYEEYIFLRILQLLPMLY